MKLYLVRHGESQSPDINPDPVLSEKGIKETETVAHFLELQKLELDAIWHSVKMRAKQTATILHRILASHLPLEQKEGLKPMDPIDPLITEIQASNQNLMIVSHLPFLEKLLSYLLFGEERESLIHLCGSCVVCLEGQGLQWKIAWVMAPNL